MARYIDADNFRKTMIKRFGCIPCLTDYSEFSRNDIPIDDALNLVHTADVAPRAEVAREIFEEIEKFLDDYRINRKLAELGFLFVQHGEPTFEQRFAALKKKYTEDEK